MSGTEGARDAGDGVLAATATRPWAPDGEDGPIERRKKGEALSAGRDIQPKHAVIETRAPNGPPTLPDANVGSRGGHACLHFLHLRGHARLQKLPSSRGIRRV